jgi:anti-sigma regulatory factor (Ser/Thr protein kinase)
LVAEGFGNPLHVQETSTFSCTMPDRLDALAEMRAELRAWLARSGVDPETAEDIVLAAWEVCANAAEHPLDPKHHDVTLVATVGPSGVCIVVEDTGSWRDTVPRPGRGRGRGRAPAEVARK